MAESLAIRNGQIYVESGRSTLIIGISICNAHFYKVENVQKLFKFASENSQTVLLLLTDKISEHNFMAIGCKRSERTARIKANSLRNKCQEAIEVCGLRRGCFNYVNWNHDVETSPAYVEALNYVKQLYQGNEPFRRDILDATKHALVPLHKSRGLDALETPINFDDGVLYPLKELAFFSVLKDIYKPQEEFVFIYPRRCDFLEKYLDGGYDGIVRPSLGIYVLE